MKDTVSYCPIEEAMQVLSGRWPTLLLYYLKDGTKRFSDLRRDNPTVSHRMLTLELRKLEDAGIVRRTAFEGYPLRVEYDLTAIRPGAGAADRCAGRLVGAAQAGRSPSGNTPSAAGVASLRRRLPRRLRPGALFTRRKKIYVQAG